MPFLLDLPQLVQVSLLTAAETVLGDQPGLQAGALAALAQPGPEGGFLQQDGSENMAKDMEKHGKHMETRSRKHGKDMERHGKTWKDMERHGKTWKELEKIRKTCGTFRWKRWGMPGKWRCNGSFWEVNRPTETTKSG